MGSKAAFALALSLPLAAQPSRPRNAAPGVGYTGSRVCAGCHKPLYDRYLKTGMGRSMAAGVPAAIIPPAGAPVHVFDSRLDRHFEVFRGPDDAVYQSEYQTSGGREIFRASHKLVYTVGSGANGRTFLVRRGNHLVQAPLSYYTRTGTWELSPGYEFTDHGFSRPIHAGCIICHAGRPRPVADRNGLFDDPPFAALEVGCENCHGPGGLHVKEPTAVGIVNPRRLAGKLAGDICMHCHQGGDTRLLQPGKRYGDFRPGTPLAETLAVIKLPLDRVNPDTDLLEHNFAMELSLCYRASGGRMRCVSCHNIHEEPVEDKADYYRGKCAACHRERGCTLGKEARLPADDCVACHMPKRAVREISHSALTNHRIVRRKGDRLPGEAAPRPVPELPGLLVLNGARLPPVLKLAAYGELLDRDPSLREQYTAALEEARTKDGQNPLVLAALGRKALRENSDAALELLEKAVERGAVAPATFLDLSEALVRKQLPERAIEALAKGVEIDPYSKELRKALIVQHIKLGRYETARNLMTAYLEMFPEDSFMRGLLQRVSGPGRQ